MEGFEQKTSLSMDMVFQLAWEMASKSKLAFDLLKRLFMQLGSITDDVLNGMVVDKNEWDEVTV